MPHSDDPRNSTHVRADALDAKSDRILQRLGVLISALAGVLIFLAVIALVSVGLLVSGQRDTKRRSEVASEQRAEQLRLLEKVDASLTILQAFSGPDAQARQAKALQNLIRQIDCDGRARQQLYFDRLGIPGDSVLCTSTDNQPEP
jgi:hypothetical protein